MGKEITTGLHGTMHHTFVDGFMQTQAADPPATMDDFRLIAEWVKAGGLHYLPSSEWMVHLCKLPVVLEKATAWRDGGRQPIGKERGPPSSWRADPTVGRRADDPDKVAEELERWKQG